MRSVRTSLGMGLLGCFLGHAAAIVPVPSPPTPLPTPGFEPNRGQAKPEILFLGRGSASLAVTRTAILISPHGARQEFVSSRPDPQVRYSDPLPGIANYYTGADASRWFISIPRYATARLDDIYPGVDAECRIGPDGIMHLKLLFAAHVDPAIAAFRVDKARVTSLNVGELFVQLGDDFRLSPALIYPPPLARQGSSTATATVRARFDVRSNQQFGFSVENRDPTVPLEIEIRINPWPFYTRVAPSAILDSSGNLFVAATIPGDAGADPPFPDIQGDGCGTSIGKPYACTDVAVSKFTPQGELAFVSYLSGRTNELHGFLQRAADGAIVIAGTTDSSNFPVTSGALQTQYAGPAPSSTDSPSSVRGDYFASRIDPIAGILRASTYLGGPNGDEMGEAALGADGSLYFFHKWLVSPTAGMPTTRGSLRSACEGDPCSNSYAAHLTPMLDRLLYGTYMPGTAHASAELHEDGSLYYAGSAPPGFPTTPNAYQRESAGVEDGIVARLDPTGSTLMFATYLGTKDTDWILRMAVAPDGSVWAHVSSFVQCCIDIQYALVRLDSKGERVLVNKPLDIGDIVVDRNGNLIATAFSPLAASPGAFQLNSCGAAGAYLKLSPAGEQLFASYLPYGFHSDFAGVTPRGTPILRRGEQRFVVVEDQSAGVFTGCIVDGASFTGGDTISPGALVTLFGSGLGPREGVAFQLADGRLPTSLGGTRVFVNGEAVPLLYSSYGQVNALMPYTLPIGARPEIQVVADGNPGNVLSDSYVAKAGVSIFRTDDSTLRPAAALNEDGTVNSISNPARPGSRIALFGTGGGQTNPPNNAGEITPLELRPMVAKISVYANGTINLPVEYAGGAPGLLSGVIQINVNLPDSVPTAPGVPPGTLRLDIQTQAASFYPGPVSIFVSE